MKRTRPLSIILIFALLIGTIQLPVHAEKQLNYIPEAEIGEDIINNDVFYIGSSMASIGENDNCINLLKIGRGGDAAEAAGVNLKIADITTKYGKDFKAYIYNTENEADNAQNTESILEMVEDGEYTETPLKSVDEYSKEAENNEELKEQTEEAVQKAVEYVEMQSGIELEENASVDPVQEARAKYTGINEAPQQLSSSSNTLEDMQKVANVITSAIVGANLMVDFAPGEKEKYIAIETIDNSVGDGDRYFYMMLDSPYGSTTNSAASNFACTITDDEYQEPSVISFSEGNYTSSGDSVKIEIKREGAINSNVSASLKSVAKDAVSGRDFSPVDMEVAFPLGIETRTIEIPVRNDYIEDDVQFMLELTPSSNCTVATESAIVTVEADKNEDISLFGIEQQDRLSDIVLGDSIDVSKPELTRTDDHFGGKNYYGDNKWLMCWQDDRHWYNFKRYTGTVCASWRIGNGCGYEYAGVQVKWDTNSDEMNIKAGFLSTQHLNWGCNMEEESIAYSQKRKMDEVRNLFYIHCHPGRFTIYNEGCCKNCYTLGVKDIKPIYRPYLVELVESTPLKFLNDDGTYSEWKDANFVAISGATNQTNNTVIRYAKDGKNQIALIQNIGGNAETPYTYISKINIKNGNSRICVYQNNEPNISTHSIKMNREFLEKNVKNIRFYKNNVDKSWQNQTGSFGERGEFYLEPEFSYKDAKVVVKKADNNIGYFNISGSEKNIDKDTIYIYHKGDKLYLSSVVRDEFKNYYKPVGFKVSYKYNESDTQWVRKDQKVYYTKDNATAEFLDDNQRLKYGYYEVTPIFEKNGNVIAIQVSEEDVNKLDQKYGFMASNVWSTVDIDGKPYRQYIYTNNPIFGKIYPIAVSTDIVSGDTRTPTAYHPIWTVKGNDKKYVSDVFYHEASNDVENNVITLSLEEEIGRDSIEYNHFVSGYVVRPMYNLRTHEAGTSTTPAIGATVSVGGCVSRVGADGAFKSLLFKAYSSPNKAYYIRYVVSLDGGDLLKEDKLESVKNVGMATNNKGNEELAYNTKLGLNTINSNVSSINNKITVTIPNDGNIIIVPENDVIEVKLKQTEASKYTKRILSKNGEATETVDCEEKVKAVKFMAVDPKTKKVIKEYTADKENDEFVCGISANTAILGQSLYVQVTTDKPVSTYGYNATQPDEVNETTYSEVYTGFDFVEKTDSEIPVLQSVSIPANMSFATLPLLGDVGMSINLPYVTVGYEITTTGYKMYIGASVMQIYDKVKGKHASSFVGDNGKDYAADFAISHPIDSYKNMLGSAWDDIVDISAAEDKVAAAAALGSPQWKFDVIVGVYFDFVYANVDDGKGGKKEKVAYFSGVGGFVGVNGGFKVAWYTILPVVFVPAYFGVHIEAGVMGFFGAGTDTSKPKISLKDARKATVDFDSRLGKFSASVMLNGLVQIYAGVGLAEVLGIRGGGEFTALGMWEPSKVYSDLGCRLRFRAGLWVDLLLFSVPIQYVIAEKYFGSLKEAREKKVPGQLTLNSEECVSSGEDAKFSLRSPISNEEPKWVNYNDMSLNAGFDERFSTVVEENGYEHPDVNLLTLDNGDIIMVFLDSDPNREETERSVLKYSICSYGIWSDPKVVQDDDTADFFPDICKMEDGKIMVAWASKEKVSNLNTTTEDYSKNLEIYTAVIDANSKTVSEITRLTDDNFTDYLPKCIYDEKTKDRAVYYMKTSAQGDIEKQLNSYSNNAAVVYLLYSGEKGKWMLDEYFDEELLDTLDRQEMIEEWKGQRFISSPIPEFDLDVPNISDFDVASFDGTVVYAYTVDKDSNNDTTSDKELFIQIYDCVTYKSSNPIRITYDTVSDTKPQLLICKDEEGSSVKLFWYRDGKNVTYFDISELIKEGIDENGQIKESFLTDKNGNSINLSDMFLIVSPGTENKNGTRYMADFKAITDNENVYVVWTQPDVYTDENGEQVSCKEVYATGFISDDTNGANWSKAYRLTNTNTVCDEPNASIDSDGNLVVLYNNYKQELTEDANNPVNFSDFKLISTFMEPCGEVNAESITLSTYTPKVGDEIEITVKIKNDGLTLANGYLVTLNESKNGVLGNRIETTNVDEILLPNNTDEFSYYWTVPEDFEGTTIVQILKKTV